MHRFVWWIMHRQQTDRNGKVRYSAAYLTGAERCPGVSGAGSVSDLAILSSNGCFSVFEAGGDTIRFATSPRLVRYTRVKEWDDGYLVVGVDYGHGEVEDYIDIRQILDNLYYDSDSFLKNIKKVEVRYD